MASLRLFPSGLSPGQRRVYGSLVAYFLVVFAAMLWPIYPWFSAARPLIAGLPLSLFYLTALLLLSFGVLLALYAWEARAGRLDSGPPGEPPTEDRSTETRSSAKQVPGPRS